MRKQALLLFAVLTLGGGGCGKSGPAAPASLTSEQVEVGNKEQKRADDDEKAHLKADPGNKKGPANSVDEEERRARRGR